MEQAAEWDATEKLLADILLPLFEKEGYKYTKRSAQYKASASDAVNEWDIVIRKDKDNIFHEDSIGVEVKLYKEKKVGAEIVRQTLDRARASGLKRTFIFCKNGFTNEALEIASRYNPQELELYDIESLKNWVVGSLDNDEEIKNEISYIIRSASKAFIEAIAKNPRALDSLEWRDLERLLSEAFEGLGFSVTLTPPSKDGGKDLILEYEISGKLKSYVVEVKHWRAGNKVGGDAVSSFLDVIVKEKHIGGVFISTYGYTKNAFESLTKIQREKLKFGSESKVVSLCKTYVRANKGLWSPEQNIQNVLFENTI
nr:restriction endonuclease [Pseudoalteromonas ruthenica]